jgi:hypothetical protein
MAPQFSIETKKIIMDTKLVREFGTEILSYRLRTVRQKKRMQYEDFDKKLLRLRREEKKLDELNRNLGWETLTPPVQKGWKRFFVLRDDVARSKHCEFFENILNKINTFDWHYRRDFKVKKRRYGKGKYAVKTQILLRPCESHFQKLGFNEVEKSFFYDAWKWEGGKRLYKYYVFKEPWRFVLRVRPNMIDKIKRIDAAIQSRSKEIDNYLERNNYRNQLWKILDGNVHDRWYAERLRPVENVLKNKSIRQILNDIDDGLL